MLVKPDEVSGPLVKALQDDILKNQAIMNFLDKVRDKEIDLEKDMYKPLVCGNRPLSFEYSCFE